MGKLGEVRFVPDQAPRHAWSVALVGSLIAAASVAHAQEASPSPIPVEAAPNSPTTGEFPSAVKEPEVMIAPTAQPPAPIVIAPATVDGAPAIAVLELMQTAKIIGSETFRYTEPITLVGLFFLAMSLVSAAFIRAAERTLNRRPAR